MALATFDLFPLYVFEAVSMNIFSNSSRASLYWISLSTISLMSVSSFWWIVSGLDFFSMVPRSVDDFLVRLLELFLELPRNDLHHAFGQPVAIGGERGTHQGLFVDGKGELGNDQNPADEHALDKTEG